MIPAQKIKPARVSAGSLAALRRLDPPTPADLIEAKRKRTSDALFAANGAEFKTEGRTPRPFRINPHD